MNYWQELRKIYGIYTKKAENESYGLARSPAISKRGIADSIRKRVFWILGKLRKIYRRTV
jgi:hypothetical protein